MRLPDRAGLALLALPACVAAAPAVTGPRARPLSYLSGHGERAYPVVGLTWGLMGISVVVVVVVAGLVLAGVLRRRVRGAATREVAVERRGNGLRWIWIGVGISLVPLIGSTVWTMQVLAAIGRPAAPPALTIEVTAQQWWWKLRYLDNDPSRTFLAANEIHIPVGQPVELRLRSPDVIHSFWVPALGGKMDVVPGQVNRIWLQAGEPGVYEGRCAEFCGMQHANMRLLLVAETQEAFRMWRDAQVAPAPPPATEQVAAGAAIFVNRCGACHTVRGTMAGGTVAPDLTHLMGRAGIAAETLRLNVATLSGWIADPQHIKPGTRMPNLNLSGPELQSLRSFLGTLR